MTTFLRLSNAGDKASALEVALRYLRRGRCLSNVFVVHPDAFRKIPGSPFSYSVSDNVRRLFETFPKFETGNRTARVGLQTSDDFRFVRCWWECSMEPTTKRWFTFVRGGRASSFFGDNHLVINWYGDGAELKAWHTIMNKGGHWSRNIRSLDKYMHCGITWPLRAARMSPYPMPQGSIFSVRGAVAFTDDDDLLPLLGLMSSKAFDFLFKTMLGRFGHPEFSIGSIQKLPVPQDIPGKLAPLVKKSWSHKRFLQSNQETSHAFAMPAVLFRRRFACDSLVLGEELDRLSAEIDEIVFGLYGFDDADRASIEAAYQDGNFTEATGEEVTEPEEQDDEEDDADESYQIPTS